MPIFYCFNCGSGTNYTLNKPKVCLKCNQSFYQPTISTTTLKTVVQTPTRLIDEPSYSEPEEIPVINPLSFASAEVQRPGSSFTLSKPVNIEEKSVKLKKQPSKPRAKK